MHGWVECVPNVSEGQNESVLSELEEVVRSTPGVVFLKKHLNPDHNRSVFTFVGPGEAVRRAAFRLVRLGIDRIDLSRHVGVHPRMGAIDVIPFVPLGNTSMEECVALSRKLGKQIGEKLEVPVFLYDESATAVNRRSLAAVRKGGFEAHRDSGFPQGPPDFGPPGPHPTAGAIAVGARSFLIALNVILDSNDLDIAKTIARAVRESSGGLPAVRALGLPLRSQGLVQVSTNLQDFGLTSLTRLFQKVDEQANRLGVAVLESEVVGLLPRDALVGAVWDLLKLPRQRRERVIEDAVENSGAFTFAGRLCTAYPVPGGGAAAARTGYHAGSLLVKVLRISLRKSKSPEQQESLSSLEEKTLHLSRQMRELEDADQSAFMTLWHAYQLPRKTPEDARTRQEAIEKAAQGATETPLRIVETATAILEILNTLLELARDQKLGAESDIGVVADLLRGVIRGAYWNVQANVPLISNQAVREGFHDRWSGLSERSEALYGAVQKTLGAVLQKKTEGSL